MQALRRRSRVWLLAAAAGGSLYVLEGCDPAVRDTVLQGVSTAATGLSTTFIEAFFQSLMTEEDTTATTVRADIEFEPQIFA